MSPTVTHSSRAATANGVPTPRLYGALLNDSGEEVDFLEPLTATGFRRDSEPEWRDALDFCDRSKLTLSLREVVLREALPAWVVERLDRNAAGNLCRCPDLASATHVLRPVAQQYAT